MVDLDLQIKSIQDKLQQLLKQYLLLQKENERLNKEAAASKAALQRDAGHIEQLKQQVAILKTAAGMMNEVDKKVFDKQLNHYIKEIDKCIGMLSE